MLTVSVTLLHFRIYRGALWILGEYCSTKDDIQSVMTEVRRSLGEVCLQNLLLQSIAQRA